MKKQEFRISKIIIRDPRSTMSPEEYTIWKINWDRLWAKLIGEAQRQIAEDKKKGIKFKPTPKNESVKRSFEMAEQLNIELPKSFRRLFYYDVYSIERQLEWGLRLKNWEKGGCKVVFEPTRLLSSEIISRIIERTKTHKAKGLRSFAGWQKM